jgi:hypothetical protein
VPRHARPAPDGVEFYSLKLIRHLCKRDLSTAYALAIRLLRPADAAKGFTPLMTLLPPHYHARIVKSEQRAFRLTGSYLSQWRQAGSIIE